MINLNMTFIHDERESDPAFSLLTGIVFIVLALVLSITLLPFLLWLGFGSAWGIVLICLVVGFFLFGFTCCYRSIEHQWTWGQFFRSLRRWLVSLAVGVIMYRIEMAAIKVRFHTVPIWGYLLAVATATIMGVYLYHAMRRKPPKS